MTITPDELTALMYRVGSNWRCEETIKPILQKWEQLKGYAPRSPEQRAIWKSAARAWYEEFGESPVLLEKALRSMTQKGLACPTPRSCIKEALEIKHRPDDRAARMRYLEGKL